MEDRQLPHGKEHKKFGVLGLGLGGIGKTPADEIEGSQTAFAKAKEILKSGAYTCVLTDGTTVHTSMLRGVKPLVQFLESGIIPPGFSAADKVVGRATAYLYVLLGVREIYSQVISKPAIAVLRTRGIFVQYEALVPSIVNRKGDGICPFEAAVMEIHDPRMAYAAILQKMREMNITM